MIPDGRISRVRFETAAYTVRLPSAGQQLKSMVDIRPASRKFAHSLANRGGTGGVQLNVRNLSRQTRTTCPEVLCSRSITFLLCSYDLMCQSQSLSPTSLCRLAGQSLQFGPPSAGLQDLPDVTSRESFSRCLDLYPGSLWGAFTRFFPQSIGLPQSGTRSALSNLRATTSAREPFRGCSHSLMFRPPDLLATQVVPTAALRSGRPWLLLPSTAWIVTSPRVGYANRPFRAIDGKGISPHKIHGAVGRIHRSSVLCLCGISAS
jgi:hypothetical protein